MNTEFLKRLMVTGVAIVMFFTDLALSIVPWSPENKKIAEIQKNPLALPSSFMITAHAGAMSMPDNSIEALTVAVSAGVDAVELDLSFRPDGTPVIIHDSAPSQKAGVSLDEAFGVIAKDSKIRINLDMKSVKNLPGVYELLVKHTL